MSQSLFGGYIITTLWLFSVFGMRSRKCTLPWRKRDIPATSIPQRARANPTHRSRSALLTATTRARRPKYRHFTVYLSLEVSRLRIGRDWRWDLCCTRLCCCRSRPIDIELFQKCDDDKRHKDGRYINSTTVSLESLVVNSDDSHFSWIMEIEGEAINHFWRYYQATARQHCSRL